MKKWIERKKKIQAKGQASIEFIVVVLVVFFFLLFHLSLAIVLVVSSYMEFVTFMTARTLKSGVSSQARQEQVATEVFRSYTQKIEGIATNFQLRFDQLNPEDPQTAGVVVTYDIALFYLPPLFVSEVIPDSVITLTTESYLGRDPAITDECRSFFDRFANRFGLGISGSAFTTQMADNGC